MATGHFEELDPEAQKGSAPTSIVDDTPDAGAGAAAGDITGDERYAAIQLKAYERHAQRGFESGHDVEDWLQAEEEVDAANAQERP